MADLLLKAPLKYEPKTTNRFIARFPNDIGVQSWAVESFSYPKATLNMKEMKFLNTQTYVNTSYQWGQISVKIRDFIAPSQTEAIMEWFRLHAESVTGRMGYAIGCAKNIELESLDPTGVATEKWLLVNCMLRGELQFGEGNYSSDDVRKIDFIVQPQYCIHLFG